MKRVLILLLATGYFAGLSQAELATHFQFPADAIVHLGGLFGFFLTVLAINSRLTFDKEVSKYKAEEAASPSTAYTSKEPVGVSPKGPKEYGKADWQHCVKGCCIHLLGLSTKKAAEGLKNPPPVKGTPFRRFVGFKTPNRKREMMEKLKPLYTRENLILALLYSTDDAKENAPVIGRTKMMKELFLIAARLAGDKVEPGVPASGFSFTAGDYGPVDNGVYEVIDEFIVNGTITANPDPKYRAERYILTSPGISKAKEAWASLDERAKIIVKGVKSRFNQRPLSAILSYVYMQYPRFTENSKIIDSVFSSQPE